MDEEKIKISKIHQWEIIDATVEIRGKTNCLEEV